MYKIDAISADIVNTADHHGSPADIRQILLRDGVLETVFSSGKCIEHILGFVQLRVGTYHDRLIRLHLWGNEESSVDEPGDVHSHMWSFKSYVLNGALENNIYKISPSMESISAKSPKAALYEVRYSSSGTQRIRIRDNIEYELEQTERIARSEFYNMEGHQFHSSQPARWGTVSLLITQRSHGRLPQVIRAANKNPVEDYPFINSTASAKRQYLQWTRQLIA